MADKEQKKFAMPRSLNVLSLDGGGGIRGAVSSVLLDRIQTRYPNFFRDLDLIIGVSTGGIQALSIAADKPAITNSDLYENAAKFVFADAFLNDFQDLWSAGSASYSNKNLRKLLELQFGTMKLRELDKKVAILTFDLDNGALNSKNVRTWRPKLFHNYPGQGSDGEELVVDVAMRTCATPIYFPTYQGYCDGCSAVNNPAMLGLTQALESHKLEEISVLSLGAGQVGRYIKGNNHDWGSAQWGPKLLYMMLEGSTEMVNLQCKMVLKERFHRINPAIKGSLSLDSWEKIPELLDAATNYDLGSTINWLEKNWK